MKKWTTELYHEWIRQNRPEYTITGEYQGDSVKIVHTHIPTGLSWLCAPSKFKAGVSHPQLSRKSPMKYTHQQYVDVLREICPRLKVLDTYVNTKKKLRHLDTMSGRIWLATPEKVKRGHTPPWFTNNERITNEEYDRFLEANCPGVIRLDDVTRRCVPIRHNFNGLIYRKSPKSVMSSGFKPKIHDHATYVQWLRDNRPEYEIIDTYVSSHVKAWHLHIPTQYKWFVKPNNVQQGQHAPILNAPSHSRRCIMWLDAIMKDSGLFIQHAENGGECHLDGIGKVDGFCQTINTVFEFHGDFWHGNPLIYDSNDINPRTKTTFGELYEATVARERRIVDAGYTLVTLWDSELDSLLESLGERLTF